MPPCGMSFSRWHLCCAARGRLTSSVVASARVVLVALMALTSIPTTRAAETLRDALAAALVRPSDTRFVPYIWSQEPEVIALYYGAAWCAPCHELVPKLKNVYEQLRKVGANTEVVFVSLDRSEREMRLYMTRQGMPWPALDRRRLPSLPGIQILAGKAPPNLVLIDRTGRVLASAWAGDSYLGPTAVLAAWLRHFEPASTGANFSVLPAARLPEPVQSDSGHVFPRARVCAWPVAACKPAPEVADVGLRDLFRPQCHHAAGRHGPGRLVAGAGRSVGESLQSLPRGGAGADSSGGGARGVGVAARGRSRPGGFLSGATEAAPRSPAPGPDLAGRSAGGVESHGAPVRSGGVRGGVSRSLGRASRDAAGQGGAARVAGMVEEAAASAAPIGAVVVMAANNETGVLTAVVRAGAGVSGAAGAVCVRRVPMARQASGGRARGR
jgi:thiol-disulfide isomerase/thioredoxin